MLGTTMLSVLAGHKRYAHITALRNDGVLPELLGHEEDRQRGRGAPRPSRRSRRKRAGHGCSAISIIARRRCLPSRGFSTWTRRSSRSTAIRKGPCLATTQEAGAAAAMSTTAYTMAGLRLVLDVDVRAGNEHASKHAAPGLWALLDRIPPRLLAGIFARR